MVSPSNHVSLTSSVSQDDTMLQRAVAMLGPDWQLLNPPASSDRAAAAIGTSLPAVLANSAFGVILIDIAPRISHAAVEQFRAMLDTEGFVRVFPGNLPVVHRVLPPEHLGRLPDIIDYAFGFYRANCWQTGIPIAAPSHRCCSRSSPSASRLRRHPRYRLRYFVATPWNGRSHSFRRPW